MPGVNQQQLDGIGARFDKGFDEIKALMRSFDERIRAIELREAGCSPLLLTRIDAAEKEIVEHKKEVLELRVLIQLQAETAETLSNAVKTISGWGKWAATIATTLITSGLLFFIGRLIYLSIAGNMP
jgi:hypothetical protein